ncbi:MAG: thermonuclease family protein [bacterium]|nr:thermonuclease family protein [bacterium]
MYEYKAIVDDVYDGDTITVSISLGFKAWLKGENIRLVATGKEGVDAPEIRGVERTQGLKSRDYLRHLILGREVILRTYKDTKGKYGRWLGSVYLQDPQTGNLTDVVQIMLDRGLMEYQDY